MSHLPIQPDDELLSAYIDGELTADELRAVEEWIASDPAARAMVEELRSVSSAVQALPRASVPAEWTAKLTERLDDARGNSTSTEPPRHESNGQGDAMMSLPFGRTSRGWWWSAAAIAAAVTIMFTMPRDPNERKVASNTPLAKPRASGGEIVLSAPEAAPAPASDAAAPELMAEAPASEDAATADEGADSLAMDSIAAPATMSAPESTPEVTDFSGVATEPSTEALMSASDAPADSAYLIVWCDVPPESLREREINNLFVGNGIVVDDKTDTWLAAAEPMRQQIELRNSGNYRSTNEAFTMRGNATPAPMAESSRFAVPDERRAFGGRESTTRDREESVERAADADTLADTNDRSIEGETILVEATADQIAGCLAAMQQDPGNFKSITVEPVSEMTIQQQLAMQRSLAESSSAANSEGQLAQPMAAAGSTQAEESLSQSRMSQSGEQQGEAQQAAKQAEQAQARRLSRPEDWYFYNTAPKEAQQGYRLPMQAAKDNKVAAKSEYSYGDKKQQLAELNRYVTQAPQQQLAGQAVPAPLAEKQPVQVLFVLRNSLLPDPVAAAAGPTLEPAAESTELEAEPARAP